MPTRIYALAKELKIDSKDLVDVCAKAGISGKGSALASLDDEEVRKVKTFISGDAKPAGPRAAGDARSTAAPAKVASLPEAFTRDDYIAPGATTRVRVLGAGPKPSTTEARRQEADTEGPKVKKKREPVININLVKIPKSQQPSLPSKPTEPKPQEPEIRLPKDAMTKKKGGRPPLEHLTKGEKKKGGVLESTAKGGPGAPLSKPSSRGRRAKFSAVDPSDLGLAGMANARAERQKARKTRSRQRGPGGGAATRALGPGRSRRRRTLSRKGVNTAAPRKSNVALELPCTVRSFSEAAGAPSALVQQTLMKLGAMVTINALIDEELVELLAAELGVELEFKQHESLEDALLTKIREQQDDPSQLEPRPPVVTFLGHVDHGKTSLLDRIIGSDVVSGEAGGITQHIRAYQVDKDGRKISFVDTPGHEAFTEMRARGANVTDVAVLVIAADDGVMPQTEEAISHAKAAHVPIVVALNKIDLPGADPNRVLTQMTEYGLTPSQWGGDTEIVQTSAVTGQGIDDLLETLLGLADLHECVANPGRDARGACLEAQQEPGRGVIAKLIVQNGTLRVGDVIVCGAAHGRVKAMYDTLHPLRTLRSAGPSTPANVTGLDIAPAAGDAFYVLEDIGQAREIASQRAVRSREKSLAGVTTRISFEEFQRRLEEGRLGEEPEIATLNLIIRADVRGSIEAIQKEFGKLEHPEVQVKTLQASVGGVTAADVALAAASDAVIIGFSVIPDEAARILADERQVEIRRYDVIYKLTDDIKSLLEGKLKPEERVVELGRALVKQVFPISRVGAIAGCYVAQGSLQRGCRIRVNRDSRTIGDYQLDSLRREKDDVKEVSRGMECGVKLAGFSDVKKDDILEAYRIEEVARTF